MRDIIVCGHSHCGVMKALFDAHIQENSPAVHAWLRHAEETHRRIEGEQAHLTGQAEFWASGQMSVLVQLEQLRRLPAVERLVDAGQLRLHGWVYRIETGEVLACDGLGQDFLPIRTSNRMVCA